MVVEAMIMFISDRLDERAAVAGAADVATLRRITATVYGALQATSMLGEEGRAAVTNLAVLVLQGILAPFSDHPDYDPGWVL